MWTNLAMKSYQYDCNAHWAEQFIECGCLYSYDEYKKNYTILIPFQVEEKKPDYGFDMEVLEDENSNINQNS